MTRSTTGRKKGARTRKAAPAAARPGEPLDMIDEIFAGCTVFLAMSYIVVTNPAVLEKAGMAPGPVFVATCLSAAIGSIACGYFARSPTALAPGMAFNVFVANYVASRPEVDWPQALIACALAGCALIVFSWTRLRMNLILSLPGPIKIAINSGIGAILASVAIGFVADELSAQAGQKLERGIVFLLFFLGLAVIAFGDLYLKQKSAGDGVPEHHRRLTSILANAAPILSVVALTVLMHWLLPVRQPGFAVSVANLYAWDDVSMRYVIEGFNIDLVLPLMLFVLYMLLADIAGTPYQLLESRRLGKGEFEERVAAGFRVDSAMNVLGPALGTTPVVYYAENNAGKLAGGRGGTVAVVAGLLFLVVLAAVLVLSGFGVQIFQFIPKMAIAPVLFYVGLKVIAEYMGADAETIRHDPWREVLPPEHYLVPAAITVVVTPIVGLENSLAAGLLAFFILLKGRNYEGQKLGPVAVLFGLGVLALAIQYLRN